MADTDRLPVVGGLHVNTFEVMDRAVEEGTTMGVHHAYKYTESPTREAIIECVVSDVMGQICEVFNFDEPEEV